jgi:hypothetical protein
MKPLSMSGLVRNWLLAVLIHKGADRSGRLLVHADELESHTVSASPALEIHGGEMADGRPHIGGACTLNQSNRLHRSDRKRDYGLDERTFRSQVADLQRFDGLDRTPEFPYDFKARGNSPVG